MRKKQFTALFTAVLLAASAVAGPFIQVPVYAAETSQEENVDGQDENPVEEKTLENNKEGKGDNAPSAAETDIQEQNDLEPKEESLHGTESSGDENPSHEGTSSSEETVPEDQTDGDAGAGDDLTGDGQNNPEDMTEDETDPEEIESDDGETEEELFEDAEPIEFVPGAGGADNDTLFAAYAERELGIEGEAVKEAESDNPWVTKKGAKNSAVRLLTAKDLAVYNALKKEIVKIADGERSSTVITIPISTLGSGLSWTASDLGVSSIVSDNRITQAAMNAAWEIGGFRLEPVVDALLSDCPYELYWYDKTEGTFLSGVRFHAEKKSGKWKLTMTGDIILSFCVAAAYSDEPYTVKTSVGQSVQNAVQTARDIVRDNAANSDYEKLRAYCDEICRLTSYNYNAINYNYDYGDPWQLIWVFDRDPSTRVVCEGYSKAFKYLCDLTRFDDRVSCLLVSGTMSDGGAHMWNIVTMENGLNYLVDVTNSDPGSYSSYRMFLKGSDEKKYSDDMEVGAVVDSILFEYDRDTLSTYEQSQIVLATEDYSQSSVQLRASVPEEAYVFTFTAIEATIDGVPVAGNNLTAASEDSSIVRVLKAKDGTPYLQGMKKGSTYINVTAVDADGLTAAKQYRMVVLDDRRNSSRKYSISFKGNGSTSGKMSTVKNVGYRTQKTLPANSYKRKGYRFAGWSTRADGSGIRYGNKATVVGLTTKNKGTVTLYAQWEKIPYTIVYNLNGGINNTENPATYYVTSSISLKKPTKDKYVFNGWYSDKKYKKKVTSIKKGSTGTKTLYAKWTPNKYSITFKGNGATSGSMKKMTGIAWNATKKLTANAFRKKGYTFIGWSTTPDGEVIYSNKASVNGLSTVNGANINLYAVWRLTNYKITYKTGSGTVTNTNPATYTMLDGTITLTAPSKPGYRFLGWYKDSKYKKRVTAIPHGSTGAKTFYAKWTANHYTILFDGNGATSGSMKNLGMSYGAGKTLPANAFRKTGHTFLGWSLEPDGEVKYTNKAAGVKNLTAEKNGIVTLYAVWSEQ